MNKITKTITTHAIVGYLSAGVAIGSLMFASIPAMNVLGWGYYAVTWPVFICHGTKVCKGETYVPSWVFTFKGGKS